MESECELCGHHAHNGKECQVEPGDVWQDGESMGAWVARPPCGCKSDSNAALDAFMQKAIPALVKLHYKLSQQIEDLLLDEESKGDNDASNQ